MKKLSTIQQNSSVEALSSTHLMNTKGGSFTSPPISGIPPKMGDELTDKRRPPSKVSNGRPTRP